MMSSILVPFSTDLGESPHSDRQEKHKIPMIRLIGSSIGKTSNEGNGESEAATDHLPSRLRFPASKRYAKPTFNSPVGSVDASLLLYARPSPIHHRGIQFSSSPYNLPPSPLSLSLPPMSRSASMAPMKLAFEEEVLVMDGELVDQSKHGRSPSEFGPGSGGKSLYKTGLCMHWHENRSCHYGSKCQFAHGKIDLTRRTRPSKAKKSEVDKFAGSARLSVVVPSDPFAVADQESVQVVVGTGYFGGIEAEIEAVSTAETVEFEWPLWEDMESKIREVLYGRRRRKRLPVFEEICPATVN